MRHLPRSLWHIAFGDRTTRLPNGPTYTHTRRQLLHLILAPAVLFPRWHHWHHQRITEPDPECPRGECRRFKRTGIGWVTAGECIRDGSHGFGRTLKEYTP